MAATVRQSEQEEVDIDTIIGEIGFGKFQILCIFFIIWPLFFSSFSGLNFLFTTLDTQYRCDILECSSYANVFSPDWLQNAVPFENGHPVKCMRYAPNITAQFQQNSTNVSAETCPEELFDTYEIKPCDNWIFGEGDTIIAEFGIPCQTWKRTLVGTMNGVGQFVALTFSGFLSDSIGRRNVMIISTALSGLVGFLQSFSPEYWSFLFFEFLNTCVGFGAYSAAFILGVEILPPDKRILGTTVLCSVCGIGSVCLGFIAWAVPNWRNFLRVTYTPSLLVLLGFCGIPESIRWMFVKGKKVECIRTIKKAAKMNGKTLSKSVSTFLYNEEKAINLMRKDANHAKNKTQRKIPFMDLLKSCKLFTRLIICSFCWMTNAFVYYGLALNSMYIIKDDNNVYLNFILVTAVELPAQLLYLLALDRIGRRLTLFLSLIGSGLSCFMFAFLPNNSKTLALLIFLLGKLLISMSFSVVYLYTSELFPTTLRNSSMSCCSMIGRIGGMLAPQAPLLANIYTPLPMMVFGGTAVVSAISILTFPETSNMKLPDSIEESETIGKTSTVHSNDGEARW